MVCSAVPHRHFRFNHLPVGVLFASNCSVVNDKVTDRVRILFLNNVTSPLYVTSLLIFYTLFFLVMTCMSVLVGSLTVVFSS